VDVNEKTVIVDVPLIWKAISVSSRIPFLIAEYDDKYVYDGLRERSAISMTSSAVMRSRHL
jgi:hypothetical protein